MVKEFDLQMNSAASHFVGYLPIDPSRPLTELRSSTANIKPDPGVKPEF
jgi:hypothetical protein